MIRAAAMVAFPLSVGIAAAAAGSLALFAVALGFIALCLACAAVTSLAARRAVIDRTIDRHEALEDDPICLAFAVRGVGGLPVKVEIRGEDGRWRHLDAAGEAAEVTVDRPGAHMLGPSALRVRDDLGLISRRVRGGRPQALLILPAPQAPTHPMRGAGAQQTGDPEPDGLRPYVPGTPMARIHWAAAARGAELQERHFTVARDGLPLVVIDARAARGGATAGGAGGAGSGGDADAALDWVARAAAGHVLSLMRNGGCRVALPGDRVPTTVVDPASDWPAMHRRLASLEPGAPAYQPPDTERDVIWLHAAAAPVAELHARAELPRSVVALRDWAMVGR